MLQYEWSNPRNSIKPGTSCQRSALQLLVVNRNGSVGVMVPAGFHSSHPRLGFAGYWWQKVPRAVRGTMELLYVSDGLGQHHANPLLRTFLSFLTWAEKQRSLHFCADDQLCWKSAAVLIPSSQLPVSTFCATDPQPYLHLYFSAM